MKLHHTNRAVRAIDIGVGYILGPMHLKFMQVELLQGIELLATYATMSAHVFLHRM